MVSSRLAKRPSFLSSQGQDDLKGAAGEHRLAQCFKLFEGELQADGKKQQRHPQLGH